MLLSGGAFASLGLPAPAMAFDFFGLFGTSEKAPEPSASALPYIVDFELEGGDSKLRSALRDASNTYKLRDEAPPTGELLARRVEADLPGLLDAVWASGFFNARIHAQIAGARIELGKADSALAARQAEALKGRAAVPVRFVVETGPLFSLRDVRVFDARTRQPIDPALLPPRRIGLERGAPATAGDVRAALVRIVDHLREQSRPLAKIVSTQPVVTHPEQVMDVAISVDPGPQAGIGPVTVTGTEAVDPRVVSSFIYLSEGEAYAPQKITDTRKSVAKIEALASVRIREAEALDANGNLPLFVEVTERKPRLFGFAARYSTTEGPGVRAYWAHRNLFGGAERLRIEADIGYAARNDGSKIAHIKDLELTDIAGRFSFSFLKPALGGSRNDLLVDGLVQRERTVGYTSRLANLTGAIRHRFSDTFNVQAGIEGERGQTSDIISRVDYRLVGFPLSVNYDSTDNLLDPKRGFRVNASVAPYFKAIGSSLNLLQAKAQASAYYSLDEDGRYVLAGRIGLGSLIGADLTDIPASRRFYAGGGGSVRGYKYKSLSPLGPFETPIGGRSLIEASLEARIRITDTIGLVPFVDAGGAFASSYPDFKNELHVAAGLGLRYYTAIGPIRLDVATPLNKRSQDRPVAVYVSLGQAF